MKNILIILLAAFILTACSGGESEDSVTESVTDSTTSTVDGTESTDTSTTLSFDDSLRGEWMYIHSGETIYIDESFQYPITKIDDTLISIDDDGTTYHLMRSGIDTTLVTGDIYTSTAVLQSISRGVGGIGNINLILKHATDENNKLEQDLDDTGEFSFENVISGDYVLTATTEDNLSVSTSVDIYGEEVSLGGFTLVSDDGYNFKTEFIINNSDSGYFYGSMKTYTGKLQIKNIGTIKGTGLNYTFNADSPYIAEYTNEIILGTVDVNSTIDIPFTISFGILDKTTETIALDITIKDVNNNEWIDTVFFHVYQTPMNVNIATKEANVKGYIIAPGHELTPIDANDANILVPYREGKQYYIVLSNPNIDSETPYSIGIDTQTLSFDTFQETGAHEPNNKEAEAFVLRPNESLVSYLHEGDIDYYIIDMSSDTDVGLFSPPQMPFK